MEKLVAFTILLSISTGILLLLAPAGDWQIFLAKLQGRRTMNFFCQDKTEQKKRLEENLPILKKRKQENIENEIYEGISYLRNITAIGSGRFLSADGILEQLTKRKGELQGVYIRMLQLLRQNQKGEAIACFGAAVDSDMGKTFGRLLLQWDDLPPENLTQTLLSHQKHIREVRMTNRRKRDETISDLIYLPVVINVMLIFINFIYVGYFIDQKDMFSVFF